MTKIILKNTFEDSFPITFSFPFFAHFPPRHHIIVNVFYETGYTETPSPPLLSLFLFHQLTKIIFTFIRSKISHET